MIYFLNPFPLILNIIECHPRNHGGCREWNCLVDCLIIGGGAQSNKFRVFVSQSPIELVCLGFYPIYYWLVVDLPL